MKTVIDFPAFAETAQLLTDLTAERDALVLEQEGLHKQLAYNNPNQGGEQISTEEAARRLANGEPLPKNNAERIAAASERELIVRQRIEAIGNVLRNLPTILEQRRQQARDAQIAGELAGDFDKVRADFEKARTAMAAACLAESRLLERLIVGGFGGTDPWITSPRWLNRDIMLLEAGE